MVEHLVLAFLCQSLAFDPSSHDFLGRSSGRGSFLIWTHNLKNITYNPTFIPAGAPSNISYKGKLLLQRLLPLIIIINSAMTLGAGVQWYEAYAAAEAHGRVLVGGLSDGGSVGAAGGWIMGGGHSAFSPTFGLGMSFRII